jgi:hypothetical protein
MAESYRQKKAALMTDLTIDEEIERAGIVFFHRSDGQRFYMLLNTDGHASLFAGAWPDRSPAEDIIGFDPTVTDKVGKARSHMLAYEKPMGREGG